MTNIERTAEAWESGELGRDEEYVEVSDLSDEMLDEALSLKLISIRMPNSLIDDLKDIAKINGIGYQPLMKKILSRFVEAEKKQILKERVSEIARQEEEFASEDTKEAACG
jgi:predicted DNA binding CopG/RHH family protein